jgi:hypothetical protein
MKTCYVCLKWGQKYSADYVNKLAVMIRRWGDPHTPIYCYTDDPTGIDQSVHILPIEPQHDFETWWFKIPLLVHPKLKEFDVKVLFDLDVIIHGKIEGLFNRSTDNLTVCMAYWKDPVILADKQEKNTMYNSSVMIWKDASYIYDYFIQDPEKYMTIYKGVDRFMWHEKLSVDTLPPGIVYSYRKGANLCDTEPFVHRPLYDVCLFHGYPKQTDLPEDVFVKECWHEL